MGHPVICSQNVHSGKEGRDIGSILPLTQNSIVNRRSARGGGQP
jgi:hypothetical protein